MASGKFTSTNTEPQATANFTGTLTSLIGDIDTEEGNAVCWAIYPYNEANTCDGQSVTMTLAQEQEAAGGTFADKFFPAVAKSNSFSLAFYNICGGVRFSVTQEGVKRVIFKSNDGSPMAGKVRVGFGEDNRPQILKITKAVDSVVVVTPNGGSFVPGAHYFAALLPQTHAKGIKVSIQPIGREAIKDISKPVTIHRSAFGTQDNIDEGLTYESNYVMVDLGLSVKWASLNLGAFSPEEYGDYFSWGEIETELKSSYYWNTYKWYANGHITKYCNDTGVSDEKTVLDPEDDVAHILLGGNWRMPTAAEFSQLGQNCSKTLTKIKGIYGWKFTGNKPGYTDKWIFLPLNGYYNETTLRDVGKFGHYWSSNLYWKPSTSPHQAYNFVLEYGGVNWEKCAYDPLGRCYGLSIRPVYDD